jgi:Protein of unknown function (DUF2490)
MKIVNFFLFLLCPLSAFATLNGNNDFQIWNKDTLELRLMEQGDFYGEFDCRFGDDASKLYYKHVHLQFLYRYNSFFTIGPGYRWIYTLTNGKFALTTSPLLDLIFSLSRNGWRLDARNRLQLLDPSKHAEGDRRWLFREKLYFFTPWKWTSWHLNPYVTEELFFEQTKGFSQNRFYVGLALRPHRMVGGALFVMLRNLKNASHHWTHQYVLGMNFSLYF